jgi:deoxyadenosine/deoxycytidine kinase
MSKFIVITGPKNSFKLFHVRRHISLNVMSKKKCILLYVDKESSNVINAEISGECIKNLTDTLLDKILQKKYQFVSIINAEKIKNNLLGFCQTLIKNNIDVLVSGSLFENENTISMSMLSILPYSDELIKLNAVCCNCLEVDKAIYYKNERNFCIACDNTISPTKYVIAVVGNIGSGKTSLCKQLANHFNRENVDLKKIRPSFKNFYNKTKVYYEDTMEESLKKFYEDKKKYWFSFQIDKISNRTKKNAKIKNEKNGLIIIDRWFEEDKIFPISLYQDKIAGKNDYEIYMKLYKILSKDFIIPDCLIMLKPSVKKCFENSKKRNNKSEDLLTLDYIEQLDKYYDHLQKELLKKYGKKKLIIFEGDQHPNLKNVLKSILKSIQ